MEATPAGLSRRELWVDARDLQSGEGEEQLAPEEYLAVLANRGYEKLAENPLEQSFEATVRTLDPTYELGKDFFLGDTITAEDKEMGVEVRAVVTAAQYAVNRDGESLAITFGYGQPTLYDKLKRKEDK